MNIQDLPNEIQNKIFYYYAVHPCAKMIKDIYSNDFYRGEHCYNYFEISSRKTMIFNQEHKREIYWNNLITMIERRKKYEETLDDQYFDF